MTSEGLERGESDERYVGSEKSEPGLKTANLGESGEIGYRESAGEARVSAETDHGPAGTENSSAILEQGRCGHRVVALLATAMDLASVIEVECSAGCGHRFYPDRGPVECPCRWEPVTAVALARALRWVR